MVTDTQVRRLMSLIPKEKTLAVAAAKAGAGGAIAASLGGAISS